MKNEKEQNQAYHVRPKLHLWAGSGRVQVRGGLLWLGMVLLPTHTVQKGFVIKTTFSIYISAGKPALKRAGGVRRRNCACPQFSAGYNNIGKLVAHGHTKGAYTCPCGNGFAIKKGGLRCGGIYYAYLQYYRLAFGGNLARGSETGVANTI